MNILNSKLSVQQSDHMREFDLAVLLQCNEDRVHQVAFTSLLVGHQFGRAHDIVARPLRWCGGQRVSLRWDPRHLL